MRLHRSLLATVAATSLVLASCTDGDDASADPPPAADNGTDDDPTEDPDENGDGSASGPAEGTIELDDVTITHPDQNVTVDVTSVTIEGSSVLVTIEAINNDGANASVISMDASVQLYDDLDQRYAWEAPDDPVDRLDAGGGELSATLAFRGAPRPEASQFILLFHHEVGRGPDAPPIPGESVLDFRFELPIPGVDG